MKNLADSGLSILSTFLMRLELIKKRYQRWKRRADILSADQRMQLAIKKRLQMLRKRKLQSTLVAKLKRALQSNVIPFKPLDSIHVKRGNYVTRP